MLLKIFLIYCLFTLLMLFNFLESDDINLIKNLYDNPKHIVFNIIKNVSYHKYSGKSYNSYKMINKYTVKIIYILFVICMLFFAPIISLKNAYKGVPYIYGIKYPLSSLSAVFYTNINNVDNMNNDYFQSLESKLFWNDLFIKNKVNTPKVYGTLKDGVFTGEIPENKELIWKLVFSNRGIGLQKFTSLENAPKKGYYILQEKISMCKNTNSSHLRVITVNNGEKLKVFNNTYFISKNKNSIASNISNQNIQYKIINSHCVIGDKIYFKLPDIVDSKLHEIQNIAINLHKQLNIKLISWDIVFTCDNYYFLEGNIGSAPCSTNISKPQCLETYKKFMYKRL